MTSDIGILQSMAIIRVATNCNPSQGRQSGARRTAVAVAVALGGGRSAEVLAAGRGPKGTTRGD